jgi:hypothetical protein
VTILNIDLDTITGPVTYTDSSTITDVVRHIIWQVAGVSYAAQFKSTSVEDALGDYLNTKTESRDIPMRKQINNHATGLLAAGVSAPGGKMIAADQFNVDNLTTYSNISAQNIANSALRAVDGTRWPINTAARATALLAAINARIAAVNGVRYAAVGQLIETKNGLQFYVWQAAGQFEPFGRDMMAEAEKWAKAIGCATMEFNGRRGWERMFPDWKVESVTLRKVL